MGYILLYSVHLWAARSDRNSQEICVPSAQAQTLWVATACNGALRPVQAALRAVFKVLSVNRVLIEKRGERGEQAYL